MPDGTSFKDMTRRDWLKAAGIVGAGAASGPLLKTLTGKKDKPIDDVKAKYVAPTEPKDKYMPLEPVLKKDINVLQWISRTVPNKAKFMYDFENLKPGDDISGGMETRKQFFDRNVTMYIVTPEQMKELHPDAGAYADIGREKSGGNYIVLRTTDFDELPTATSDGKLNQDGAETLAHELRHTTQKYARAEQYGDLRKPEEYEKYMRDPAEMGVRLASAKNLMDKHKIIQSLQKKGYGGQISVKDKDGDSHWDRFELTPDEIGQIMNEVLPDNEKDLLRVIFFDIHDYYKLKSLFDKSPTYKKLAKKYHSDSGFFGGGEMRKMPNWLESELGSLIRSDHNVNSLWSHIYNMKYDENSDFWKKLMKGYDYVVQNNNMRKKLGIRTSYMA